MTSPLPIVAVTIPSVFPTTRLAFTTLVVPIRATASLARPVKPPLYTASTSTTAPVIFVTAAASILTVLAASTAFMSTASTSAVATVIV